VRGACVPVPERKPGRRPRIEGLVVGGRATPLASFPLSSAPCGVMAELGLQAKALHFGASDGGVRGRRSPS
jgi:hypothetical protein